MPDDEPSALEQFGTRLEWAYPVECDAGLVDVIAPLFREPDAGKSATIDVTGEPPTASPAPKTTAAPAPPRHRS